MKPRLTDYINSEPFQETCFHTDYSADSMNQVSQILAHGIDDQAVSRKEVEAITIDGANSLDLDDAIWVERAEKGYCIWIHISDVSETIPIYSPLDIEAFHRTTSIYRKNHILDMFPPELANNILSLDPYGGKKLTMTLQIDLDDQCEVKHHSYYESSFSNLKRYDYEEFGKDFVDPEAQYHDTLHLLKEVSDKLRAKRLEKGGILHWVDDGRRVHIGGDLQRNSNISAGTKISHDIIESLMVLANVTTGQHLVDSHVPALLKRHDSLDERSFYHHTPDSVHAGLGMKNYTHFTSPIRRYIDVIIHRTIKALERGEESPYITDDLKFAAKHSNNTRWKIETLGSQIDLDTRAQDFMKRTEKRLGRPLEVYDMKPYIRNSTHKSLKLPQAMKDSIAELIQTGETAYWTWALGVILLGKDEDLKGLIKTRIIQDKVLTPTRFLNILTQTQILCGEGTIFELDTHEESGNYSIQLTCKGEVIAKSQETMRGWDDIKDLKCSCKKQLIAELFDYYLD